jgi:hypothetical protein
MREHGAYFAAMIEKQHASRLFCQEEVDRPNPDVGHSPRAYVQVGRFGACGRGALYI